MDGETWMVDGEVLVMMMAMILSKFPVMAGCQNGVSSFESRFLVVAAQRNSFWKTSTPPPKFLGQKATYRRRERPRVCLGRPHPLQARPGLARAAGGCGLLRPPLHLVFWLRESSSEIGFLAYFLGF